MTKSHPFGLGWAPDLPDHRDKTLAKAVTNSRKPLGGAGQTGDMRPSKGGAAHTFHGWKASEQSLENHLSSRQDEGLLLKLEQAKATAFSQSRAPKLPLRTKERKTTASARSRPLLLDEPPAVADLPRRVDLRPFMSPIEQQEKMGSCTAHAIIGLVEYLQIATKGEYIDASRLFLYKATRNLMQWSGDSGAHLRETIKALRLFGVCPERYWEYDEEKLDDEPSPFCYSFAANYKGISYYRLADVTDIKRSLAQGYPVALGFSCFESVFLEHARRTGVVPYPQRNERHMGGHAVLAVGYVEPETGGGTKPDDPGHLIIRNSWGLDWGTAGYGYLPYTYIDGNAADVTPLAEDYWTMTRMDIPDLSESQAAPFTMEARLQDAKQF